MREGPAIVAECDEFHALELKKVIERHQDNGLVDLRNIYLREEVETLDMIYIDIGP